MDNLTNLVHSAYQCQSFLNYAIYGILSPDKDHLTGPDQGLLQLHFPEGFEQWHAQGSQLPVKIEIGLLIHDQKQRRKVASKLPDLIQREVDIWEKLTKCLDSYLYINPGSSSIYHLSSKKIENITYNQLFPPTTESSPKDQNLLLDIGLCLPLSKYVDFHKLFCARDFFSRKCIVKFVPGLGGLVQSMTEETKLHFESYATDLEKDDPSLAKDVRDFVEKSRIRSNPQKKEVLNLNP